MPYSALPPKIDTPVNKRLTKLEQHTNLQGHKHECFKEISNVLRFYFYYEKRT